MEGKLRRVREGWTGKKYCCIKGRGEERGEGEEEGSSKQGEGQMKSAVRTWEVRRKYC